MEPLNLLSLPNCLILNLLSYLDATSLYNLSRTCTRFATFLKSHSSLWKHIDARRCPNDSQKQVYCLKRGHADTRAILLRGNGCRNLEQTIVGLPFFTSIKGFDHLRILAIENQVFSGFQFKMTSFPSTLEELSLKNSAVISGFDFFGHSSAKMKNLRVLILDGCDWVLTCHFMSISKYEKLEIFSVYRCKGINNSVPYLSLSGYGFKELKILDVRLSSLGNTLIRSMYKCPALLALYYQKEDQSFKLDCYKRKLEILKGATSHNFNKDDSDEEIDFEEILTPTDDSTFVSDCGLLDLSLARSAKVKLKYPSSELYLDPYSPCTCGYYGKKKTQKTRSKFKKNYDPGTKDDDSDDDDDDQGPDEPHNVEKKIKLLTDLVPKREKFSRRNNTNALNRRSARDSPTFVINSVYVFNVFTPSNEGPTVHVIDCDAGPPNSEAKLCTVVDTIVNKHCKRRHDQSHDEPKTKKPRLEDEAVAGPSGSRNPCPANVSDESGISEDEDPQQYPAERPPTPHPDIVVKVEEGREEVINRYLPRIVLERVKRDHKLELPIQRLSLRGFKTITNRSLVYLTHLELEVLDVTYTDVTESAINDYMIENPNCRVIHEKFCVCAPNIHF